MYVIIIGIDETVGNSPVRKMSLNGKYLHNLYLLNRNAMNVFNSFQQNVIYGSFLNNIVIVLVYSKIKKCNLIKKHF